MKKNVYAKSLVLLLLGVVLLLGGCSGNQNGSVTPASQTNVTNNPAEEKEEKPKELVRLRLANLAVGLGSAYHELGKEQGIFEKHGIQLEVINFIKGGAEATAGVASGQVDMGSYGTPILTGISKGLPIKIVAAPAVKGMQFVLVGRKGIESVQDLRGKTVATGALGGGNHQSFLKILEVEGVLEEEVNIVATGGTDAAMILQSGRVDAVQTNEPTVSKIVSEGYGDVLAEAVDYYGRYQHSYVFATDAFIENHPETIQNFLNASRESYEYAKNNFEELVQKGMSLVELDEAIVRQYYTNEIEKWDLRFQVDVEGTENAIEILKSLDEVDGDVVFDPETWLDLRFTEE